MTLPASSASGDFQSVYMDFALNQIDPGQLTAFRKLFSEFCLKGVMVKIFNPTSNVAAATFTSLFLASACSTISPYATAADWVSQSAGPDATARTKSKWMGRYNIGGAGPVLTTKLVPRAAVQINNPGAVPAGLVPYRKNTWMSCLNNMGTLHSGLRLGFNWQEPHPLQDLQVQVHYIIGFRNII